MTMPSHMLSAAYIALTVNGVSHTQTPLIVSALIASYIVDFDHYYYILKDPSILKQGKLHKARSIFHELIGFAVIGILMLIVGFFNQQLAKVIGIAAMIHLAEDMLVGTSIPFKPFDKIAVHILPQNLKLKTTVEIGTIIIFGFLWYRYLNGIS